MLKYKIVFSDQSREDLRHIAIYISNENIIRATTFVEEIIIFIENQLEVFPFFWNKKEK